MVSNSTFMLPVSLLKFSLRSGAFSLFLKKDHISAVSGIILLKPYGNLILVKNFNYLYSISKVTPTLLQNRKQNACSPSKYIYIYTFPYPSQPSSSIPFRIVFLTYMTPLCLCTNLPFTIWSQPTFIPPPQSPHHHSPASSFFSLPLLHRASPCSHT